MEILKCSDAAQVDQRDVRSCTCSACLNRNKMYLSVLGCKEIQSNITKFFSRIDFLNEQTTWKILTAWFKFVLQLNLWQLAGSSQQQFAVRRHKGNNKSRKMLCSELITFYEQRIWRSGSTVFREDYTLSPVSTVSPSINVWEKEKQL